MIFDINSEEVKQQLIGTTGGGESGFFVQDAIKKGMTQAEVEEKYGPFDFAMFLHGYHVMMAFYGNLGVYYSETEPASDYNNLNPNFNYVEQVVYFANISEAELIEALGEPDYYDNGNSSMNGLPYYSYEGYGEDGKCFHTMVNSFGVNFTDDHVIGVITRSIYDEDPSQSNDYSSIASDRYFDDYYESGFPVELTAENDYFTYDTLTNFIGKYDINELVNYYNGENSDIFYMVIGDAATKIQQNFNSGYYSNHENHGARLISIKQISLYEYTVTIDRHYKHANTDGIEVARVTYTILESSDGLRITNFE